MMFSSEMISKNWIKRKMDAPCNPVLFAYNEYQKKDNCSMSRTLVLEVTQQCNLKCVHCYLNANSSRLLSEKINLNDWQILLRQGCDVGYKFVQFSGGEPTIYPDLPDLICYARKCGFEKIEVHTNGTLFDRSLLGTFIKNDVSLAISVYSIHRTVHDYITQTEGSFDKTFHSIKGAVQNNISVRASITYIDQRIEDLRNLYRYLRQLGVELISFDKLKPFGRGKKLCEGYHATDSNICLMCKDRLTILDCYGNCRSCFFASRESILN